MYKLLAVEWLKLKNYRTFWILIALYLVLLPLWNYEIANGIIKMGGGGINLLSQAYSFPEVWGNVGFWGSIFITFLSILVIIITTNEYNFRTNRQNIIDGWKRLDFLHSKVLVILGLSLVATLYFFVLGAAFGLSKSGYSSSLFDHLDAISYFFLLSVNYLGLAFLIAIWIKRSGLAISLFLLYDVIIEKILQNLINWRIEGKFGNFLPLQSSDELLPLPLWKMAQSMLNSGTPIPPLNYVTASVIWCLVYYAISRSILLRSDW